MTNNDKVNNILTFVLMDDYSLINASPLTDHIFCELNMASIFLIFLERKTKPSEAVTCLA